MSAPHSELSTLDEFRFWVDDLSGYGGGRRTANLFLHEGIYSAECDCEDDVTRTVEVCLRLDLEAGTLTLADAVLELGAAEPSSKWLSAQERQVADIGVFVCWDSRELWLAEPM